MLIALPKEKQGLPKLLEALSKSGTIRRMLASDFDDCRVEVSLPKFKVKGDTKLPPILEAIGIKDLFSQSRANLSGVSEEPLYVSDAFHSAVLEVSHVTISSSAAGFKV